MKKLSGFLGRELLIVILSILLGMIFILCVFLFVPDKNVESHSKEAIEILQNEGTYWYMLEGIQATCMDNFTDAVIVGTSATKTESLIEDTLLGTRREGNDTSSITTYGRYWHGYQVFMRPLISLMGLSSIRYLNSMVQLSLVIITICLFVKTKNGQLVLPFIIMWFSIIPIAILQSLQYSPVFYVTILTVIGLMKTYSQESDWKLCLCFEISGILTSYLDLLTYPMVSLGVPLILYFSLTRNYTNLKEKIKKLFVFSLSWGIGYVGMWSGKWMLATLFTKENIIENAIETVRFRSSTSYKENEFTLLDTIWQNLSCYHNGIFIFTFFIIVLLFFIISIKKRKNKINVKGMVPILIVALYPAIWYLFTMNHSNIHAKLFTYRELGITIYAVISVMFLCHSEEKERERIL